MKHNTTMNGTIAKYQYVKEISSEKIYGNPNLLAWITAVLNHQKYCKDNNITFGQDVYNVMCIYDNEIHDYMPPYELPYKKAGVSEVTASDTPNAQDSKASRFTILLWYNKNKIKSCYDKLINKAKDFSL